jgi:hypothetical protein
VRAGNPVHGRGSQGQGSHHQTGGQYSAPTRGFGQYQGKGRGEQQGRKDDDAGQPEPTIEQGVGRLHQPLMRNGGDTLSAEGERVGVRNAAGFQNQAPHRQVVAQVAISIQHLVALAQDSQEDDQEEDVAQGGEEIGPIS